MAKASRWPRRSILPGVLVLAVAGTWWAGERYAARDWLPWFVAQKGELVSVAVLNRRQTPQGMLQALRLTDNRGLAVDVQLRLPPPDGRLRPVLVILGGVQTGGRTSELVPDTGPFILASVDYPYAGRRRGLSVGQFLAALPAMRRAVLMTAPATMLVLDYLHTREDVDRDRIVLAGGSFGALLAPAAAAAEPRIDGLVVLFGAGDLESLIAATLDVPGPFDRPVAWIANLIVSPVEPLKYIGRVAPRPVLLVNGRGDARMPEALGRKLQEQAGNPKKAVWLDIGHATIRSTEFRAVVIDTLADWLAETGVLSAGEADSLRLRDEDRPKQPDDTEAEHARLDEISETRQVDAPHDSPPLHP